MLNKMFNFRLLFRRNHHDGLLQAGCCCGLFGLLRMGFQSSLARDGAQLHGQAFEFIYTDVAEGFAGDSGIAAETIHAVPVGGVDAELLHQFQYLAALAPELPSDAFHELVVACFTLHVATHMVILLSCSFAQRGGSPVRILLHKRLLVCSRQLLQ